MVNLTGTINNPSVISTVIQNNFVTFILVEQD